MFPIAQLPNIPSFQNFWPVRLWALPVTAMESFRLLVTCCLRTFMEVALMSSYSRSSKWTSTKIRQIWPQFKATLWETWNARRWRSLWSNFLSNSAFPTSTFNSRKSFTSTLWLSPSQCCSWGACLLSWGSKRQKATNKNYHTKQWSNCWETTLIWTSGKKEVPISSSKPIRSSMIMGSRCWLEDTASSLLGLCLATPIGLTCRLRTIREKRVSAGPVGILVGRTATILRMIATYQSKLPPLASTPSKAAYKRALVTRKDLHSFPQKILLLQK